MPTKLVAPVGTEREGLFVSAAWGHGFHTGLGKGRVQGGLVIGAAAAALAAGKWGYDKVKERRAVRLNETNEASPEVNSDGGNKNEDDQQPK